MAAAASSEEGKLPPPSKDLSQDAQRRGKRRRDHSESHQTSPAKGTRRHHHQQHHHQHNQHHQHHQSHRRPPDPNRKRPLGNGDFLLGGNLRDPLNLASVTGQSPAGTPTRGSPEIPAKAQQKPIAVLIPKSTKDPLNLSLGDEDETAEPQPQPARTRRKRRRKDEAKEDPIVSPVIQRAPLSLPQPQPQPLISPNQPPLQPPPNFHPHRRRQPLLADPPPRTYTPRLPETPETPSTSKAVVHTSATPAPIAAPAASTSHQKSAETKANLERFRYGNYNRYYGTRLPNFAADPRLGLLNPDWLRGRQVLDIGCNIGHLTAMLARDCGPARCLGIDIDPSLITVARKNVRHYMAADVGRFPPSFAREYGPIELPSLPNAERDFRAPGPDDEGYRGRFPENLAFAAENYVLLMDAELERVREEWDAILALSVTKWVQLNWGDAGLKRFFQRAFRSLRPGGVFVLEPQPWSSYRKKMRQFTEGMKAHLHAINLTPDKYVEYLLQTVGFSSVLKLKAPGEAGGKVGEARGFDRPIYAFFKTAPPKPTTLHIPSSQPTESLSEEAKKTGKEKEAAEKKPATGDGETTETPRKKKREEDGKEMEEKVEKKEEEPEGEEEKEEVTESGSKRPASTAPKEEEPSSKRSKQDP